MSKGALPIILVDTSVWIEFFNRKPQINPVELESILEEKRVVTCFPIRAELLSGTMSTPVREVVTRALESLITVDPDWNKPITWQRVVASGMMARKKGIAIPGLVDRMILESALECSAALWTLDKKLKNLARHSEVPLFPTL